MIRPTSTVFVVDDDPAVRKSLRWLLESEGLSVETCSSAELFLERYDQRTPGCLVLDLRMAGMDGLKLQQELLARGLTIPIIVITAHGGVSSAAQAFKAGVVDYLEKPFDDTKLLDCIGQAIVIDEEQRRSQAEQAELKALFDTLSERELEVLQLVASGLSNKQIASRLFVTTKTIEFHRGNITRKLAVKSVAELVQLWLRFAGN